MAGVALGLFTLICVVFGAALYFLPLILAINGGHRQTTAIGALNLLLGWTGLGWIAALVWALTKPSEVRVVTGATPVAERTCPSCGTVYDGAKFCPKCSFRLS